MSLVYGLLDSLPGATDSSQHDQRKGTIVGKAWGLIEAWRDAQPFDDIKDAQLARLIGFSQSNFPTWRNPKSLPERATIGAIAIKIGVTYDVVRDAFLADLGYDEAPSDDEIAKAKAFRKGRSAGRTRKQIEDEQMMAGQDDGPEFGA